MSLTWREHRLKCLPPVVKAMEQTGVPKDGSLKLHCLTTDGMIGSSRPASLRASPRRWKFVRRCCPHTPPWRNSGRTWRGWFSDDNVCSSSRHGVGQHFLITRANQRTASPLIQVDLSTQTTCKACMGAHMTKQCTDGCQTSSLPFSWTLAEWPESGIIGNHIDAFCKLQGWEVHGALPHVGPELAGGPKADL